MKTVLNLFGVDPFRIGGNEAFAREVSRQLQEVGWQNVLVFEKPATGAVRDFLSLPNVHLECLDQLHRGYPGALAATWGLMQKYQPTVLHLHFVTFLSLYPWLARLRGVRKIFFTDQGSWPEGHVIHRAPYWKRMIGRAVNAPITGVLNVSDYGRRAASGRGYLPPDRYQVIYNSVDLARFESRPDAGRAFRQRHQIPEDRIVVLQVSWIIPEKGIGDLLAAARDVIARDRRAHFVFAGEGAYRKEYMRQADELGISGHVTWTGLVQDPVREGLFDASDIVCQMSRWEEVFGWVIAEAMASRKPLVGTRVGGIPELIEDGVNGYLVSRGDTAAMTEKILSLMVEPDLRQRFGLAGYQTVESKFDLERNVSKLLRLYGAA